MSHCTGIPGCDGQARCCSPAAAGAACCEPQAASRDRPVGKDVRMGRGLTRDDTKTRKYQYMESNMQRKAAGLKDKIPDIQKTLETVQFLKTRTVCRQAYLSVPCP